MKSFVYNFLFRNNLFSIEMELQTMEQLFEKLAEEKIGLSDKYALIYNQLRLTRREMKTLVGLLSKIDGDFE
jgi:hypothetical protein